MPIDAIPVKPVPEEEPKDFLTVDGVACDKEAWLATAKMPSSQVGLYKRVLKDGSKILVHARFTGIDHGEKHAFEIGIMCGLQHGYHKTFATYAECLTDFNKMKAEVEAEKDTTIAPIGEIGEIR